MFCVAPIIWSQPRGGAISISSVLGNTLGLKPNQLRRIEKLYTRRIPPNQILTAEFARQIAELSHETRRQIGVLIDRKGHIEYVMVGDNRRIELPDFKRIRDSMKHPVIVDGRNIWSTYDLKSLGFDYRGIGVRI